MRLLLIEDEIYIANPLQKALEKDGFAVDYSESGKQGLDNALINEYDCIILDLNLPEIDGLTICKKLRQEKINTPILMLTARSQQYDKITGFETGTDDYLTKPFNYQELLLRIKALIRRKSELKDDTVKLGNLEVNIPLRKVTMEKENIALNNKEFRILEYLLRNKGRVVSQEELLEHVWDDSVDSFSQTVKTTINNLRNKIDPERKIIFTRKGAGYVIE